MPEQATTNDSSIDGAASALDDGLARRPMPCPFSAVKPESGLTISVAVARRLAIKACA